MRGLPTEVPASQGIRSYSELVEAYPAILIGRLFCVLSIVFASADIWPTINVGFTLRVSQLFILAALLLMPSVMSGWRLRLFPGGIQLLLFFSVCLLELPVSLYLERSLAYCLWLFMDISFIIAFVHYYRTRQQALALVNAYLASFIVLSLFGVSQFLLGIAGIDMLVKEWWIEGRLPRVNGLSYEPSYYATYLTSGWVLSWYLTEKGSSIVSARLKVMCLALTTAALILSSSRMVWFMMICWIVLRGSLCLLRAIGTGYVKRSALRRAVIIAACAMPAFVMGVRLSPEVRQAFDAVSFLTSGIGIFGGSDHSSAQRTSELRMTVNAFLDHPLIGTGIGALPVEIASQRGEPLLDLDDAKQNEGMSIGAELLASTGLVGGLIVGWFILKVVRSASAFNAGRDYPEQVLTRGLVWSSFWLLLTLQLNQNFLRLYIFTGLAVLIAWIFHEKPSTRSVDEGAFTASS